jgi:alkaline phosphatase D
MLFVLITGFLAGSSCATRQDLWVSQWPESITRTWVGPEYWGNRLQDWRLHQGRVECLVSDYNRSLHLLTHQLKEEPGDLSMSVELGILPGGHATGFAGWAGFIAGARGEFGDYRDNAIYGRGLQAGVQTNGQLFIGTWPDSALPASVESVQEALLAEGLQLRLQLRPREGGYDVRLEALREGVVLAILEKPATGGLSGNLALAVDFPLELPLEMGESATADQSQRARPSFWFRDWRLDGGKLEAHPGQTFGPVMFTQHSLSKGTLKMTAQMAPLDIKEVPEVQLQGLLDGAWQDLASAAIDPLSRTATFRVENWPQDRDVSYRVRCETSHRGKEKGVFDYEGTVRRNPADKNEIVVAAFTGNNDLGFPNNEIVRHVMAHQPDLLVFTGDQIYEPVGGFGIQTTPFEMACLDYLRKWYLYGWAYRDMLRDIPSVSIPDDHDVYQGNIWGAGGKAAGTSGTQKNRQDEGGYTMPPDWVRMVERTQTSHLPDPFDPTPVGQGIGVYYCDLNYGGISFAVIEDRKWKSAPKTLLPARLKVENGWAEASRRVDPAILDVPGAVLLGERQHTFLEHWVGDWSHGTVMKAAISQTIFSTVATLPDSAMSDVVVPTLRISQPGEYTEGDIPTQDMDSNGWPKRGRDAALRILRKAFAVHIAGDQHLATTIQYGIDDWGDASYAICVPSISNYYPRRWFPDTAGKNRKLGAPLNTGEFFDGFGNRMTVHAVANPQVTGLEPSRLYDRSAGYGIVRFDKNERRISLKNWPRQTDPASPGARPYEGWPVVVEQMDNYGRKPVAWLPEISVSGLGALPVLKVIDEKSGELVYALRLKGQSHQPVVFAPGSYTVIIEDPDAGLVRQLNGLKAALDNREVIQVDFE